MAARLEVREAELRSAQDKIQQMNIELEQKVVERTSQLCAANQELEAFTYSVSHDLRAPLRHLDGFAQLLAKHKEEWFDEKGQRYLNVISQSARKMGRLIDELLVFCRMGRTDLLQSAVEMGGLVREAVAQIEAELTGRTRAPAYFAPTGASTPTIMSNRSP